MQLDETIATYNVDLALRGENGKFEVTSPAGETYYVTHQSNQSFSDLKSSDSRAYPQAFLIRKIAEPVSREHEAAATSAEAEMPTGSLAPFLIETHEGDVKTATAGDPMASPENPRNGEILVLELLYSEGEATIRQPFASVHAKSDREGPTGNAPLGNLTARCMSLNELDAEIRRLHARLDEIHSHAKKKFYQAQAASASA
jgi:hypothetical protein